MQVAQEGAAFSVVGVASFTNECILVKTTICPIQGIWLFPVLRALRDAQSETQPRHFAFAGREGLCRLQSGPRPLASPQSDCRAPRGIVRRQPQHRSDSPPGRAAIAAWKNRRD